MSDLGELDNSKLSEDLNLNNRLGRDEFLYDIIGINITGLKSLKILITNPIDYFNAALQPDWEGRHWPSIRLWLGLMTLMVGLQFIWASESSEMTAMFRGLAISIMDGINQGAAAKGEFVDFSEYSVVDAGKKIFKIWIFIYPFFFIAFMCLLGFIFRGWERKLSYIARVRFIFAIIVPGTLIGLSSTIVFIPLKGTAYVMASIASLVLLFIVYWITAFRGAYAHCDDVVTRISMSFIISLLILITLTLAQFISMMLSVLTIIPDIAEIVEAHKASTS